MVFWIPKVLSAGLDISEKRALLDLIEETGRPAARVPAGSKGTWGVLARLLRRRATLAPGRGVPCPRMSSWLVGRNVTRRRRKFTSVRPATFSLRNLSPLWTKAEPVQSVVVPWGIMLELVLISRHSPFILLHPCPGARGAAQGAVGGPQSPFPPAPSGNRFAVVGIDDDMIVMIMALLVRRWMQHPRRGRCLRKSSRRTRQGSPKWRRTRPARRPTQPCGSRTHPRSITGESR